MAKAPVRPPQAIQAGQTLQPSFNVMGPRTWLHCLMGQGLEIVQECWVREEREQLLTTEHQEHTTPRVVRVRRTPAATAPCPGDPMLVVLEPSAPPTALRNAGNDYSVRSPKVTSFASFASGLYQREEGATQALEEEDDWQQLKQRLQELTELMECSARWRFAADSAQQVEGRLRALEAENLELTRKLQASSSASGSEAGPLQADASAPFCFRSSACPCKVKDTL
ncbi:unnamed protein product [Durusdinium trenchii]|uniref:Uncharacterized protein n=1 Tax=Durusdinium trenchii TaxID=1381693 RepID=A0ABP0QLH6_9DINO